MLRPNVIISYTLREAFQRGLARDKIIFLSAGPGWGKTAVVTKLLEKQNTVYVSLGRRTLPGRFSRERQVVLDDVQALPPQAEGQLQNILRRSPPEQRFFLLSRGPMPDGLTPYEAAGALLRLGEAELALDMDCLNQLAQAHGLALPVHELRWLLDETGGCPPAVNLLLTALAAGQDLPGALYHYQQAGSRERVLDLLIQTARQSPDAGACRALRDCAGRLGEEEILQSPDLMCAMSMLRSMTLEPEESERWYEALNGYLGRMDRRDEDDKRVRGLRLYLDLCLPHRDTAGLPKAARSANRLLRSKALVLPEIDVTGGLPSVIRGRRDLSQWVPRAGELCGTLCPPAERVLGRGGVGLEELIQAESLLEQGGDISGWFPRLAALQPKLRAEGTPELEFVCTALLARAMCAAGRPSSAEELLLRFRGEAEQAGKRRVLSNLDAMRCRLSLLGDGRYATAWLAEQPPGEDAFLWEDSYRCLTRARCWLRDRRHHDALLLLGRLLDYFRRGSRPLDRLETLILTAVCRFCMGCGDWEAYLAQALELGERYGYVAVFAREGAALLPLLECGGHNVQNPAYRERILAGAVEQAGYYGRTPASFRAPASPLTQKERTVLRLISQNKSNEEICGLMNIKLPTVKTHVHNLLRKLNVSNRNQARRAAEQLNLL